MELSKTIYTANTVIRKKPQNINAKDMPLFEQSLAMAIDATTILLLNNPSILKRSIFNPANFRFYTSYSHILKVSKISLYKKIHLFFLPYNIIDKSIWITDEWSSEYFHWFTDALTRLIVVENWKDCHHVLLPKEYKNRRYIKQSLELLGFKFYYYNTKKRLKVKELILPSHTAPTGNYNIDIINRLREMFLMNNNEVPQRKIYISRQKAEKRKILNESAVADLIVHHGYEVHFFEDYDLKTQIKLMSQAKFLIGLHGAGLTNMLFMKKEGKVLELRNENDAHNNCFFSLASALDHDYYYLLSPGNTADTQNADFIVDIKKLEEIIELMEREIHFPAS